MNDHIGRIAQTMRDIREETRARNRDEKPTGDQLRNARMLGYELGIRDALDILQVVVARTPTGSALAHHELSVATQKLLAKLRDAMK